MYNYSDKSIYIKRITYYHAEKDMAIGNSIQRSAIWMLLSDSSIEFFLYDHHFLGDQYIIMNELNMTAKCFVLSLEYDDIIMILKIFIIYRCCRLFWMVHIYNIHMPATA